MTAEQTAPAAPPLGLLPVESHRPAWLCACGTTLHPAHRPYTTALDTTPPRCPLCATHGQAGKHPLRQVTITITEGWVR